MQLKAHADVNLRANFDLAMFILEAEVNSLGVGPREASGGRGGYELH
jgi:hypothetical protein